MLTDELTVFDIKYNEGMERLNNLLSEESNFNSIKNYVERYKLEKSRENRISQKSNTNTNRNIFKDDKRKQIVDIYEIRDHDKKVQQFRNKNYLKNEIEWFKIKKREDEHKNKYNYNKSKYENDSSINKLDYNKDIIRSNNIKMKKFSNLANKVNIDKIIQLKKLNQNQKPNTNSPQKSSDVIPTSASNYNNYNMNDGIFIPYSEYLKNEMNNKNKINIKKVNNFNPKKSEKIINNIKNNNASQNKNFNTQKNNTSKNNPNMNNNNMKNIYTNKSNINIKNTKNNNLNNNINNNINNKNIQSLSANRNKVSQSQDNNKNRNKNTAPINNDKRYKIDIRKPLDKKIDYLREKKTSQDTRVKIYESKQLFKDKKNVLNNIELLNYHSKKYEDEAKRQELLMRVKGNKKYGNEDNVKLSNLLIDSISTKLAILNQITTQNK